MNFLGGIDNTVNKLIGDGGDPTMAPDEQMSMDPMSVLAQLPNCQITEKASAVEALSALAGAGQEFEMPNKYKVLDPAGNQVFFIVEATGCCERQLKSCIGDCAPWNVEMRVVNGSGEAERAFHLERPWTCTCCCFNRPHVSITNHHTDEPLLGMTDPCACCDLTFTITDPDDNPVSYVKGGCCQMGLCCPLPCGPCSSVHFDATDADGNDIGSITKKVPSCLKFLATPDVDNYELDFSGTQDPLIKLGMIAVSVFIDFRYFNENSNSDGGIGGFDFDG